jgi:hypothetical protein
MTPEHLAGLHPRLFHVADQDALSGIERHGLLSTTALLDLFEIAPEDRVAIERRRRPASVPIAHAVHGRAVITDNIPLSEAALAGCLDDGLSPADWLVLLNRRVFLWPSRQAVEGLLAARANRGRTKLVVEFDTLSLAAAHRDRVEIAPINTGNTRRRPARRGLSIFTPLDRHSYDDWRRLRGGRDVIREVTVVGGVADAARHIVSTRPVRCG